MLKHSSIGSMFAAANIGLSCLSCSWSVNCLRPGVCHKNFLSCTVNVKWDCVLKEYFSKTTTLRRSYKTSGVTSLKKNGDLSQYISKRNWNLCIFHKIILSIYKLKIITSFLKIHRNILFPKKCRLIHYLILFGSHNINIFCKTCAKF